ncbi:unnamed protein product, partial [Dovyalis caffra]
MKVKKKTEEEFALLNNTEKGFPNWPINIRPSKPNIMTKLGFRIWPGRPRLHPYFQ